VEGDPTRIPGSECQGMRVPLLTGTLQAHQDNQTEDRIRSQRRCPQPTTKDIRPPTTTSIRHPRSLQAI